MAKIGREIVVDIRNLPTDIASNVVQALAAAVTIRARQNVAYDENRTSGLHLRETIQTIGVSRTEFYSIAEKPYAAAQEYGRPDLKNYTYTPYMGPASEDVSDASVFVPIVNEAVQGAITKNRRKL